MISILQCQGCIPLIFPYHARQNPHQDISGRGRDSIA